MAERVKLPQCREACLFNVWDAVVIIVPFVIFLADPDHRGNRSSMILASLPNLNIK